MMKFEVGKSAAKLAHAETKHQQLEAQLRELGRRRYLSDSEQALIVELKKKKLAAKDQITRLKRSLDA